MGKIGSIYDLVEALEADLADTKARLAEAMRALCLLHHDGCCCVDCESVDLMIAAAEGDG